MAEAGSDFGRATTGGFQGFCPECGAVGPIVSNESDAEDFEYAHRALHEDC